ncbi:MAG: hypothetical protein GY855_04235 [candidate division Zixibacteria bacterium]|nr:hypothetical protein [candidate division Zixibacteria bacterium]
MILHDKGLYFKSADLWMDSSRKKDICYVSHAHADHTAKHKQVICTPETGAVVCQRLGKLNIKKLNYDEWFENNGYRLKLFPAGHVLGSSQVLVETNGHRLVYTGDFRLGKSYTCQPATVEKCDTLIMETTYGSPKYTFPDREEIERDFIAYIEDTLNQGVKPIVLAYAFGKAQEAMAMLADKGIEVAVHESIYKIARIYERFGIKLCKFSKFRDSYFDGVLIIPPHVKKFKNIQSIKNKSISMLTGWGVDGEDSFHSGVDRFFIISDHCDFNSLVDYVKEAEPSKIYTVHGFDKFAEHLRNLGFDAESMESQREYRLGSTSPENLDLFK